MESKLDQTVKNNTIQSKDLVIDKKNLLGRGSSAIVYRATWQGRNVAVKIFEMKKNDSSQKIRKKTAFNKEVGVMVALRHPNVVDVYGACTDRATELKLVMELMTDGSLRCVQPCPSPRPPAHKRASVRCCIWWWRWLVAAVTHTIPT